MSKKIVFMGTPEFSVRILETLVNSNYIVESVYTQPPKKSARGQKINITPVHKKAKELKIKVRTPINLNNNDDYNYLKKLSPLIVIVVAYGQIIPKKFLELPQKGFINIHASLLPKWRGAAPIQRSIMNLETETGISFMKIEEGLDTGPFMSKFKININSGTSSKDLSMKLSKIGADNILDCIKKIENNDAKFFNQNNEIATYAKKIKKSEAKVLWSDTAIKILAKINALNPVPGAWFEYNGNRYKIWKANVSDLSGKPGDVLDDKLTIACKEKSLQINEIQKEGKKKLSLKEFLAGTKIPKGSSVS